MLYSIITPVYNREDCIARCIESVISQLKWNTEVEHIIVDDGSTDRTKDIINLYISQYQHIKCILFTQNRGTNAARNAAINAAKGDFCIILDSDDYFTEDALNTIKINMLTEKQYTHYLFASDDRQQIYSQNPILNSKEKVVLHYTDFLCDKINGDFIHIIKTDTFKKNLFDEDLKIYEGVFFLRFYKIANNILFINKIVTIRERNRKDSVSRTTFRTNKESVKKSLKSKELELEWFLKDLIEIKAYERVASLYVAKLENLLLLSDYKSARICISSIKTYEKNIPVLYYIIYKFRLGRLYQLALKIYLYTKYSILKTKLRG